MYVGFGPRSTLFILASCPDKRAFRIRKVEHRLQYSLLDAEASSHSCLLRLDRRC